MATTELTELMQSGTITSEVENAWPEIMPLEDQSIKMPPFSWDMLPPVLGDMGAEITRTINVSPMLVLGAILGCASTAVGKKTMICIKKDHRQFANLFFLVSAPPCTGKSPVMTQAIKPLNDWETLKHNEWEEASQKYNKRAKEIEVKKAKLEKSYCQCPEFFERVYKNRKSGKGIGMPSNIAADNSRRCHQRSDGQDYV